MTNSFKTSRRSGPLWPLGFGCALLVLAILFVGCTIVIDDDDMYHPRTPSKKSSASPTLRHNGNDQRPSPRRTVRKDTSGVSKGSSSGGRHSDKR